MSTAETEGILEAALEYAERGWRVMPIRRKTKIPYLKSWQNVATTDRATVQDWWRKWPSANVGIVFGKESGIIDIEADDEEGEKTLSQLFSESGIVTPTFTSARGKHRIFRYEDDLPAKASIKLNHADAKLGVSGGSYSVFPPSIHENGVLYTWLSDLDPESVDPAPLPEIVRVALWNYGGGRAAESGAPQKRSADHWERIVSGAIAEGQRNESLASFLGKMLRDTNENLEETDTVTRLTRVAWAVNLTFHPPLDAAEFNATFMSILRREITRRAEIDWKEHAKPPLEAQAAGAATDHNFRLVVIDSEPFSFELHSDNFLLAENHCLELTAEQAVSGAAIRVQALKQASYPLPASFAKAWGRENGMYQRLLRVAEHRPAPPEKRRLPYLAGLLIEILDSAARDLPEPDPLGNPARHSDGSLTVTFSWLTRQMRFEVEGATRLELSKILHEAGAKSERPFGKKNRKRYWRLHGVAMERLEALSERGRESSEGPAAPASPYI